MQIVVSDQALQLYMEAADVAGCDCFALEFPAPGECSFLGDVNQAAT